ncbi:MAG: glycosyltransferase family 4 protein [Nitrososphaeria archaeon]
MDHSRKVLIVAERDTITGRLKTGPSLRLKYFPRSYVYELREDGLSQSNYIRNITFNPMTTLYMLAKALFQRAFSVGGNYRLVHSFFWNFYRYRIPWIHENDQSPSQLIFNYLGLRNGFGRKVAEMAASIINGAEAVITWSEYAKNGFIEDGVDKGKVQVVPLPYHARCERLPHEGINVLFVGRDYFRKGGDIAVRLMLDIVQSEKDVHFYYVGKGFVPEHPNFHHYENLPRERLERLYSIADLMLYPSRNEAYGLAILEAQSYGIPVIASNLPAFREMLGRYGSGYAVSPDEMKTVILDLIRSGERRSMLSENACRMVREVHDPARASEALERIYDSVQ